jgi:hypothetical protein
MLPTSPQPPYDQAHLRKNGQDEKEDLFATLFSPPTPPASPFPALAPDNMITTSNTKPQSPRHSRRFSTSSSEFGSFVSVPTTEDPLYANHQAAFSPISLQFFDQFTDHAVKSNAEKRQVLDELLLHQDDPLYWVDDTNEHPHPDPGVFETDPRRLPSSQSLVPLIPEEPSPDPHGSGQVSDRYANWSL